ncbi:Uncharacterised protein [Citrobacter braakii]|nr:Uncharacterised protein [Citrobacter braakii]
METVITTAFDVERQVAPHHCHTDYADLLLGHYILLSGCGHRARLRGLKCGVDVNSVLGRMNSLC